MDFVIRWWNRLSEQKWDIDMPGNPREMITIAERRFPIRIRVGVPATGFGTRHTQMTAWLDENCGSDGWAMTPSGTRGVVNDAVSIYFADATLARLSPGGAPCPRRRRMVASSACVTMNRRHGSGPGSIGRLKRRFSLMRW